MHGGGIVLLETTDRWYPNTRRDLGDRARHSVMRGESRA